MQREKKSDFGLFLQDKKALKWKKVQTWIISLESVNLNNHHNFPSYSYRKKS